jgi:uncharacterized protein YkwD
MRNPKFLLAVAVLAVYFVAAFPVAAQKHPENEQALFDAANRERAAESLPALRWDESLAAAARKHANRMAFYNVLEHQLPGEPDLEARLTETGARFGRIAENIAVASSPETIHAGWMSSPGHRKNILNPKLTAVGIATVRGSGGLFAVQDFTLSVTALSIEEQEKKIILLMTASGMRKVSASDDARRTCEMENGIAAPPNQSSVQAIRFDTSDLSALPDEVEKRLRGLAFQKALVGACKTGNAPGFAHYRVAILLF